MARFSRKVMVGVLGIAAVVATPAIAQAANLQGEVSFTTKTAGSKESGEFFRVGSMRICGDIIISSGSSQYIMQLKRDLVGLPDPVITSKYTTYSASEARSPAATGVQGNAYYTRGAWQLAESNWHNGYFVARS